MKSIKLLSKKDITVHLFALIAIMCLSGCSNIEKESLKIVDNFLTQTNDGIDGNLDSEKIDNSLYAVIKSHSVYLNSDWNLTFTKNNDDEVFIKATGQAENIFGNPVEIERRFLLKKIENQWKIYDTYNYIVFPNPSPIGTEWSSFWDKEKDGVLSSLKKNLKLEVIEKGTISQSGYAEGSLRLLNNSEYDINTIKIDIEHFDANGKSVNLDTEYLYDIKKNGYREFEWTTLNCYSCFNQKFEINFWDIGDL